MYFIHIHEAHFSGIGAVVHMSPCQWNNPKCTTWIHKELKYNQKKKGVCIFHGMQCTCDYRKSLRRRAPRSLICSVRSANVRRPRCMMWRGLLWWCCAVPSHLWESSLEWYWKKSATSLTCWSCHRWVGTEEGNKWRKIQCGAVITQSIDLTNPHNHPLWWDMGCLL